MSLLTEKETLSVQEAASFFGVAEETIRRDLNVLENQSLLVRTHGGAVLADNSKPEISYEMRKKINIEGKDRIGMEAAKLVSDGDTIILDASTSSFFVAKHIRNRSGITVITNAQNVISELSGASEIEVVSTGGVLRRRSMSYVGGIAENSLSNYHANKLFFSCMGFSASSGLTDSNGQESDMKKIMIERSQKIYFLCDHTKFDKIGYASTAKAEDIDYLITDQEPPASIKEQLQALDTKVVIVD